MRMGRRKVAAALLAALAGLALAPTPADAHSKSGHTEKACGAACRADLERAREATATYRDVTAALADGYVPVTGCDHSATGAVGYHFFNDRNGRALEIEAPELLLYLPDGDELRLVAIEYFQTVQNGGLDYHALTPPDPPFDPAQAPVLFRHRFEGPMAHEPYPTMWHYDLHVWAWARNPSGTFAHYNPALSCGAGMEGRER